jgi:flagellar assembly factor FliW
MPQIPTCQFGLFDYDPAAVVEFPTGLPGFETERRFVLIERPALAPVLFLQSLTSPGVCFPAAPVHSIDPQYELAVTPEDLALLGVDPAQPVLALAILSAPENAPLTANLLAPVVIDPQSRRAVQSVRIDRRYSHRQELASREAACS